MNKNLLPTFNFLCFEYDDSRTARLIKNIIIVERNVKKNF